MSIIVITEEKEKEKEVLVYFMLEKKERKKGAEWEEVNKICRHTNTLGNGAN